MSVESEILRIQHNIANTYAAVAEKGGAVPLRPDSDNLAAAVSSIPSIAELISGDGLSKDGNTLNVDNPNRGILTQAEFAALTEEQRSSGTYLVDEGQGGSSGWETYSTEERRVGTWIDGKPLYRKIVTVDLGVEADDYTIAENVDSLVYANGIAISTAGIAIGIPNYVNGNDALFFSLNNGKLALREASYNNYAITMTVKYTKTTDQGVIQ